MNSDTPVIPSAEEILSQLGRMLASKLFKANRNSANFLSAVVDLSLNGSKITEPIIGFQMFGQHYSPESSKVRVAALKLRSVLSRYYESDGRDDRVIIALPPLPGNGEPPLPSGSAYRPQFLRRHYSGAVAQTFDNFLLCDGNAEAHSAALRAAQRPKGISNISNPLLLHGERGVGKSHLLLAIQHEVLRRNPAAKVAYVDSWDFVKFFREKNGNADALALFSAKSVGADVLLLDDINRLFHITALRQPVWRMLCAMAASRCQVVLTNTEMADKPTPKRIDVFWKKTQRKFPGSRIVNMAFPDLRVRVAVLMEDAKEREINITERVAIFMAMNTMSFSDLRSAFRHVRQYATLLKVPITFDVAYEALKRTGVLRANARRSGDYLRFGSEV